MPLQPTQKDIARALGVSIMTVSLALRNSPRLSAATRKRVTEASARMGYQINPYVRAFVIQHRRRKSPRHRLPLALLNLWTPPSFWKTSYWCRKMHEGFVQRADELGYSIDEIAVRAPGMTARRVDQILKHRGIRGVLVTPSPNPHSHLSLDWQHYAAIVSGYTLRRPNLHRVTLNPVQAMQLTLHHLKHSGYRRIGLRVGNITSRNVDNGWTYPMLQYQSQIPARERVPILYHDCQDNVSKDRQEFLAWVKRYRPEVVTGLGWTMYAWLAGAGYSVPDDIGLVQLNWDEKLCESAGVELTGMSNENRQIGMRSIDLVVSQLEHNEYGIPESPTHTMIAPRWIPGKTIRRRG